MLVYPQDTLPKGTLQVQTVNYEESLPQTAEAIASTHRELQFENEHVKVWKTIILPVSGK